MSRLAFSWVPALVLHFLSGGAASQTYDLIVKRGRVLDGTGSPWYRADIGVRGGFIAAIGDLSGQNSRRTIDAEGLVVSPGFIDLMGGSSLPLLADPASAESKLRQGITTMLAGEGGSLAPQDERTAQSRSEEDDFPITWRTFDDYFRKLERKGLP